MLYRYARCTLSYICGGVLARVSASQLVGMPAGWLCAETETSHLPRMKTVGVRRVPIDVDAARVSWWTSATSSGDARNTSAPCRPPCSTASTRITLGRSVSHCSAAVGGSVGGSVWQRLHCCSHPYILGLDLTAGRPIGLLTARSSVTLKATRAVNNVLYRISTALIIIVRYALVIDNDAF